MTESSIITLTEISIILGKTKQASIHWLNPKLERKEIIRKSKNIYLRAGFNKVIEEMSVMNSIKREVIVEELMALGITRQTAENLIVGACRRGALKKIRYGYYDKHTADEWLDIIRTNRTKGK